MLFLAFGLLLPSNMTAQSFADVIQNIYEAGKLTGEIAYLEFRDSSLRQYAVAEGSDPYHVVRLSFIEETWIKSGSRDVIDQWVIRVEPYAPDRAINPLHRKIVELDSRILAVEDLDTTGAEDVVERIVRKVAGMNNPSAQAQPAPVDGLPGGD